MKIPSSRARRDMEAAAELRAAGATWETIGEQLGRLPNVVLRWVAAYREEWERMLADAERRQARHADNESRAVLQRLLRHGDPKVRLGAADKLAKRRLAELAAQGPPDPRADLAAFLDEIEEMSDDELEAYLTEFIERACERAEAAEAPGVRGEAGPDSAGGGDAGAAARPHSDVEGPGGAAGPG